MSGEVAKFRADLQRWAQAEWDRLHPRGKDGYQSLRRDIEALLRGYRPGDLWPLGEGEPLPPEMREGRRPTSADITPVPITTMWLESGYAAWDADTRPRVYGAASVLAYLAGSGTAIPGTDRTELWLGRLVAGPEACTTGSYAPAFSDPPEPDAAGSWLSLSYPTSAAAPDMAHDPAQLTGLARLWAQATLRAGTDWVSLLPSGWSSDPKYLGMVREPLADVSTGDAPKWYLVQATSSGCWVAPLVLESRTRCMAKWIAGGDLTGEELIRAEAWIFSVATVGDAVQIADDTAMASAYNGASTFIWGWYWADQKLGAAHQDDAKAVTVMATITGAGVNWRINSRVSQLDFAWADHVPTVTPSAGNVSAWTPGWATTATLYIPTSSVEWVRLIPPTGTAAAGTSGPVCAWFDSDGEIHIAEFLRGASYAESDSDPADTLCGISTSSSSSSSRSGSNLGWRLHASTDFAAVDSSWMDTIETITVSGGATTETNTGPSPNSWWPTNGSPTVPDTYYWYPGYVSADGALCVWDNAATIVTTEPGDYDWPQQTNVFCGTITDVGHRTNIVSGNGTNVLAPLITPGCFAATRYRWGAHNGSWTKSLSQAFPAVRLEHSCAGNTAKRTVTARPSGSATFITGSWSEFGAKVFGPDGEIYADPEPDDWTWLAPDSTTTPRSGICQVQPSYLGVRRLAVNDSETISDGVDSAALGYAFGVWIGPA